MTAARTALWLAVATLAMTAVLALEAERIDCERVMSVDRQKVDGTLEVTAFTESDVSEIEKSEYVRKAEVDDDVKESRLQGLKDRLAPSEEAEAGAAT
ncbi:hypothetical protein C477_17405 [Haloterrigena salina JCM 13891]|uniref:Uncharacterized protein n=1 Tax=Haloterrigena salina JCM 13891 TaxID=1227488 RepID=M0BX05_9EURY|nr:hypothetical protein C477_17405 [Haloterrigena salina JCM 13891]